MGFEPTRPLRDTGSPELRFTQNLKEEFSKWLKARISEETARKYVNLLEKYLDELSYESLRKAYEKAHDKANFSKAVRNLLNYLVERKVIDEITANELKKAVPIPKAKADRVFLSDDDILEAINYFKLNLSKDRYLVFLVILHSGMRLRQVLRVLNEFDEKYLHIFEDFARYELSHVSLGHKEGFWLYMPKWLSEELRKLCPLEITEDAVKKAINFKTSTGRLVSAKYIRKWFNNLLVKLGVEKDIRNFIMGRSGEISRTEGDYYLELLNLADQAYSKVIKSFPFKKDILL